MSKNKPHIVVVLFSYLQGSVENFFNYAYSQVELVEELAKRDVRITVLTRYTEDAMIVRNNIRYFFVKDTLPCKPTFRHLPLIFFRAVLRENPDIVHIHGLIFPLQSWCIGRLLKNNTALVGEYHSDPIWKGLKGRLQRLGMASFHAVLFTNASHAASWLRATSFDAGKAHLSIEASSLLQFHNRDQSREKTGFHGAPIFLWVSRLIPRRDPMTVLSGFESALKKLPKARFYILAPDWDDDLLSRVRQKISRSWALSESVTLMPGRMPHHELAPYYNSADYLLSGSLDDAYGFAAADTLACGVIPIVTNIPTFRHITGKGRVGGLWSPGDAESLCKTILRVVDDTYGDISSYAVEASKHFEKYLSYPVLADNLIRIYRGLISKDLP